MYPLLRILVTDYSTFWTKKEEGLRLITEGLLHIQEGTFAAAISFYSSHDELQKGQSQLPAFYS